MTFSKSRQQDLRNFPIEKARCQVVAPSHLLGTASLIIFGWTIKFQTYIAGPEIMLFFIGFGISTAFNTTNTLLIDLNQGSPATATAALNFVRCLISAGGVAIIVPMIEAMNAGWAFTFIGLVYLLWMPMIWVIVKWGPAWRKHAAEKKERKEAARHAVNEAVKKDGEDSMSC